MQAALRGKSLSGFLLFVIVTSSSGCATVSQRLAGVFETASIKTRQQQELASIRQDTRERLSQSTSDVRRAEAQREIELARFDAERRQIEVDICVQKQEDQHEHLKNQLKQSIESQIAFKAEHGLEVGELEVDIEELQKLIDKKKEEQNNPPKPPEDQHGPKTPCSCCDRPCGCRPGLIRRLCPHCRNKPCEAERDCGGPDKVAELQREPQRQPLRPAEIPLKLPVKLSFGVQQPQLVQTNIKRRPPQEDQVEKKCCQKCGNAGHNCDCVAPSKDCVAPGAPKSPPGGDDPEAAPRPEPSPPEEPAVIPSSAKDQQSRGGKKRLDLRAPFGQPQQTASVSRGGTFRTISDVD